jgi:hypothetical protein
VNGWQEENAFGYLKWIFCKMGTCTGVEKRGHQPHLMKVPRALAAEVSRSGKKQLIFYKNKY